MGEGWGEGDSAALPLSLALSHKGRGDLKGCMLKIVIYTYRHSDESRNPAALCETALKTLDSNFRHNDGACI